MLTDRSTGKTAALSRSLDYLSSLQHQALIPWPIRIQGETWRRLVQSIKLNLRYRGRTKSPPVPGERFVPPTREPPTRNKASPKNSTGRYQEQYRQINEALTTSGLTDEEIRSLTHRIYSEINS